VVNCLKHMTANKLTRIEATQPAEATFVKLINDIYGAYLWPKAKSWYNGSNIPGKKVEALIWTAGAPFYHKMLNDAAEKGYEGFVLS